MRFSRLIIALLATALMGFATLGGASSASANDSDARVESRGAAPDVSKRALPARDMNGRITEPGNRNVFYFKGNVNPGHTRKIVKIQYKNCWSCSWRLEGKDRTDGAGRYKERIYGKRTSGKRWFRAVAYGHSGYRKSYSNIWIIKTY